MAPGEGIAAVGDGAAAPFLPPGGLSWDRVFRIETEDGIGLRCAVWNSGGPRGHVLYLNGRTEFVEKVALPAAELAALGFAVASFDWRGQGLSDRLSDPWSKGHIDDYAQYYSDLNAIAEAPEIAALSGPRVVMGHSMGGLIAAGALLDGALEAKAGVLSAPMFEIALTRMDRAAAVPIIAAARRMGWMHGWPPVREPHRPYVEQGFDDNVLTSDRAVFDWMAEALERDPRLALAMPSIGWMAASFDECARVMELGAFPVPVLALVGSEERVVDANHILTAAARHGAEVMEIPGALHELLIEAEPLRRIAWDGIAAFLERQGL